jgi:hydroxypyruvate reductase
MKARLRQLFLDLLDELALERVMRDRIACRDGVLEVGGESIDLGPYKKVLVAAIGKAAAPMARAFAEIAAPKRVSGIIVSSTPTPDPPPYFLTYIGGHPYPDAGSMHAAEVALGMVTDLSEQHLFVCLLSGGGSAIFEKPLDPSISLDDLRTFYRTLVTCGASIVDMNVLRKHFSAVKGGRLAERAVPARQLTLYVSDVPPDQPSTVASGPTMPDESTAEDCYRLVDKLGIRDRLPASIRRVLDERRVVETPKPGGPAFASSSWVSLLDNAAAVEAVERRARAAGWIVETDLSVDDKPVAEAADRLLGRLERLKQANPDKTVAVLTGGELSSPVIGDGRGGRNQAFVLDCVPKIAGKAISVVSAGTDGIDGNSAAAGAVADGETLRRARELGMEPADFYARSDSFTFFDRLGDVLMTGPSGNNVRDVRLLVAE